MSFAEENNYYAFDPSEDEIHHIMIGYEEGDDCCDCGGYYVERRNSNTGERFLGCSNYPKCISAWSLKTSKAGVC